MTIKAVNDAPIGLPWSVEVPISDSVVKLAQDPVSSGPGEPFVSGMAFRTSYKSGNFSLASLAVARGSAKDSVKVTPGTKAGLSVYQVVATDLPGPNVLGSALSDTFDLSVKVVDSWSVGGKNIPLSVAFGRTWLTEPLSESGGSDSTGIANSVFHCPTGWVLPDSNDVKKMHNLENGSLASIGVLDGEEVWIQSGGALAIARLAFIGSKVDVSFLRASTKNATLRCVYKN